MKPGDASWLSHPGAPGVLNIRVEAPKGDADDAGLPKTVRLELAVAEDNPWVEGHFPEQAVLPGVVLLRWAIEAATAQWPILGAVRSVSNLKFQRPVLPPATLTLILELRTSKRPEDAPDHRLTFRYDQDDQACVRGGVRFA
ncbi:MAG: hypothetical protein V2I57_01710 [Xanthomonadales bacterium]|jgi:hypothetical protein|nr:hypothetical protein [Xanthomonadales bacterium]